MPVLVAVLPVPVHPCVGMDPGRASPRVDPRPLVGGWLGKRVQPDPVLGLLLREHDPVGLVPGLGGQTVQATDEFGPGGEKRLALFRGEPLPPLGILLGSGVLRRPADGVQILLARVQHPAHVRLGVLQVLSGHGEIVIRPERPDSGRPFRVGLRRLLEGCGDTVRDGERLAVVGVGVEEGGLAPDGLRRGVGHPTDRAALQRQPGTALRLRFGVGDAAVGVHRDLQRRRVVERGQELLPGRLPAPALFQARCTDFRPPGCPGPSPAGGCPAPCFSCSHSSHATRGPSPWTRATPGRVPLQLRGGPGGCCCGRDEATG